VLFFFSSKARASHNFNIEILSENDQYQGIFLGLLDGFDSAMNNFIFYSF